MGTMAGKRILVTGAASGLGRAIASAAVARGARVLLTDFDAAAGELARLELAERIREGGGDTHRVAFLALDVRSDADWAAARGWCEREWSGLDILVNNAGVAAGGPIADIAMDDWEWILDINLKGVVRGVRTFIPVFAAQGGGQVINIASLAGLLNAANMSSYNVTKAGVVSLSETMRAELAPLGIRTTVVCPSFFATNLADRMRTTDERIDKLARDLISGAALPGPKLTADDVARKVLTSASKNRFWCLPHPEGRLLWTLKRHTPTAMALGMRATNALMMRMMGPASPAAAKRSATVP
ncbi:MAG: SDR family NAD(P)-dependent oxidoreductase [Sporichthyaceae bacterium]